MACSSLACIDANSCVSSFDLGAIGQVLTVGPSNTPIWANPVEDQTAAEVAFDGPAAGLTATNVQDAIEECCHPEAIVDPTSNPGLTITAATQSLKLDLTATGSYTNTASLLDATSVQGAIDEIVTPPLAPSCEAPITVLGKDIAGELRRFNALFPMSVGNRGAVPPIAELTYSAGAVSAQNGFAFRESDDIIPNLQGATPCGLDAQWKIRQAGAQYFDAAANLPYPTPNVSVILDYVTQQWDDLGAVTTGAGWVWTCKAAGRYRYSANVGVVYSAPGTTGVNLFGPLGFPIERIISFYNGAFHNLGSLPVPADSLGTTHALTVEVSGIINASIGDTLQFRYISLGDQPHEYYPILFSIGRAF